MDYSLMKRLAFILLTLFLVSITCRNSPPPKEEKAPDFTLKDLSGKEISFKDYPEGPIIINFWATWCAPCMDEIPVLNNAYNSHKKKGLILIGIDVGESADLVKSIMDKLEIEYPVLLDSDSAVSHSYRVFGLPTTVFIDSKGIIRDTFIGRLDYTTLLKKIKLISYT